MTMVCEPAAECENGWIRARRVEAIGQDDFVIHFHSAEGSALYQRRAQALEMPNRTSRARGKQSEGPLHQDQFNADAH